MSTAAHCCFCFDVLLSITHPHRYHFPKKPKPTFDNISCPLFVTFKKKNRQGKLELRGCIGTFTSLPLYKGLHDYTISSSTKDSRFPVIQSNEVKSLTCTVSLLTDFEEVDSIYDWEVGVHGVKIKWKDSTSKVRTSTFLPEVARDQNWSKLQTLQSLVKKAGYKMLPDETVESLGLQLTRYQSSKYSLSFDEYMQFLRSGTISSMLISC